MNVVVGRPESAMNVDSAAARLFSAAFIAATAWRRAANR